MVWCYLLRHDSEKQQEFRCRFRFRWIGFTRSEYDSAYSHSPLHGLPYGDPDLSTEEYKEMAVRSKEKILVHQAEYYQNNKESISARKAGYHENGKRRGRLTWLCRGGGMIWNRKSSDQELRLSSDWTERIWKGNSVRCIARELKRRDQMQIIVFVCTCFVYIPSAWTLRLLCDLEFTASIYHDSFWDIAEDQTERGCFDEFPNQKTPQATAVIRRGFRDKRRPDL